MYWLSYVLVTRGNEGVKRVGKAWECDLTKNWLEYWACNSVFKGAISNIGFWFCTCSYLVLILQHKTIFCFIL